MVDDVLDHIPGELHIVVKVGKCDLGLDHPELCCVARGVRILCSEGGAEGVYVTKRHSVGLALELTRNGEVCALAEEVLRIVDSAVLGSGGILGIESGYSEHLACALCIRSGDDGGMNVNEAPAVEEGMDRISNLASHSEYCREKVGSGAEVRLLTKELNRMALRLKRIVGSGCALYLDSGCLKLKGLLCAGGEGKHARYNKRCANVLRCYLVIVIYLFSFKYYLHALEIRAVIKVYKSERL